MAHNSIHRVYFDTLVSKVLKVTSHTVLVVCNKETTVQGRVLVGILWVLMSSAGRERLSLHDLVLQNWRSSLHCATFNSFWLTLQLSFFSGVSEIRRRNVDPLEDPDYTLTVRVQDLGGASQTALSGNTRVQIVVQQNLWVNPGPITVREHLKETYPVVIAKVRWDVSSAKIAQMQIR